MRLNFITNLADDIIQQLFAMACPRECGLAFALFGHIPTDTPASNPSFILVVVFHQRQRRDNHASRRSIFTAKPHFNVVELAIAGKRKRHETISINHKVAHRLTDEFVCFVAECALRRDKYQLAITVHFPRKVIGDFHQVFIALTGFYQRRA